MITTIQRGGIKIHRIVEYDVPVMPAFDMIPTLTPELIAEARRYIPLSELDEDNVFHMPIQGFLVETPDCRILIDSCIGEHKTSDIPLVHQRTDSPFLGKLAAVGCGIDDIDYVMCTHLHVDHVGWNTCLENGVWRPTFPRARYVFSEREYAHWEKAHAQHDEHSFAESVLPIVAANRADLVADNFELRDFARFLPTPGHTPAHVAIRLGRDRDEAVITGDLAHVTLQARHPHLSAFNDYDSVQSAITRRKFFDRYCETDTVCCFSHSSHASFSSIKPAGNGYACDPLAG